MTTSHSKLRLRSSVPIGSPEAVYAVRRALRTLAQQMGLAGRVTEELVLVVSELATNILKYAARGRIELAVTGDVQRGPGILIVAEDEGPMFDLEKALPDGYDGTGAIDPALLYGRRGIGAGLGAVQRLTDGVRIEQLPVGKRIVAVRYARGPRG